MAEEIGGKFQEQTRILRASPEPPPNMLQPAMAKNYPSAQKTGLPELQPEERLPLRDLLLLRKSSRDYADMSVSLDELSYLLWAAAGIREDASGVRSRTAPSAGALYPVETYLAANNVEGLKKGIYHYCPHNHELEAVRLGAFGDKLASAAMEQEICESAPVVAVWSAVFERCVWKYGSRAYRYVYLDAGHIAQNFALAAVSLGLASCPLGAFFDDELNDIIGLDGQKESAIYMTAAGMRI